MLFLCQVERPHQLTKPVLRYHVAVALRELLYPLFDLQNVAILSLGVVLLWQSLANVVVQVARADPVVRAEDEAEVTENLKESVILILRLYWLSI